MLRQLSGKTHQVFTAVTFAHKFEILNPKSKILNPKSEILNHPQLSIETIVDCTDVTFAELTEDELDYYVSKYRPMDKAGAYGIQEWIGYVACTEMKGSYFNVMGFPVHRVYEYLKSL